jgi:hypothetical protein
MLPSALRATESPMLSMEQLRQSTLDSSSLRRPSEQSEDPMLLLDDEDSRLASALHVPELVVSLEPSDPERTTDPLTPDVLNRFAGWVESIKHFHAAAPGQILALYVVPAEQDQLAGPGFSRLECIGGATICGSDASISYPML